MFRALKWKSILYGAITLFAILLLVPTVTSNLPQWWSKVLPSEKIHLGLDLQGGMYLLLEVEAEKAVEGYVQQIGTSLRDDLKNQGVPVGKLEVEKDRIVLEFSGAKEKVDNVLSQRFLMMHELSSSGRAGRVYLTHCSSVPGRTPICRWEPCVPAPARPRARQVLAPRPGPAP